MSGIATAIAGSAIIGSIASNKASKRAAGAAENSTREQIEFMKEQADQARSEINKYIPMATQSRNQGFQRQADFLSSALPTTMGMMQQGNMGAQDVLAGSMPQIQNALMGGNVDYGFLQPRKINYQQAVQDILSGFPSIYEEPSQQQGQQGSANPTIPIANGSAGINHDALTRLRRGQLGAGFGFTGFGGAGDYYRRPFNPLPTSTPIEEYPLPIDQFSVIKK